MSTTRSLTAILFVILIVNTSKPGNKNTPANQKLIAQEAKAKVDNAPQGVTTQLFVLPRDLSLFGSSAPKFEMKETAEERFQSMHELIEKQAEYLKASNEEIASSKKSFETVCDKQMMGTVSQWADKFFADFFLGSDTHSIGTAAYLYTSLKTHVSVLEAYQAELALYTAQTFQWYKIIFLITRLQGMIRYMAFGLKMSSADAPTPLTVPNEKAMIFYNLIIGSAFSPSMLQETAESFFASLQIELWGSGSAKGSPIGDALMDMNYRKNLLSTAKYVCTTIIHTSLVALEHSSTSSCRGLNGQSNLKEVIDNYKTQFFNSYLSVFFQETDDAGNYLKLKSDPTKNQVYFDTCNSPSDLDVKTFGHQLELVSWALIGEKLSFDKYTFRKFFSNSFYINLNADSAAQAVMVFDRFVIMGPTKDQLNYEGFNDIAHKKTSFHFNFFQDYMKIIVVSSGKLMVIDNTMYTYDIRMRVVNTIKAKPPGVNIEQKILLLGEFDHFFKTLQYIYQIYSYLRFTNDPLLPKVTNPKGQLVDKNDAGAVEIYTVLLKKLLDIEFLQAFMETNWIIKEEVLNYWVDMLTYVCYKVDINGKCPITDDQMDKIYKTITHISWIVKIRIINISFVLTILQKIEKEAQRARIIAEIAKLKIEELAANCKDAVFNPKCVPEADVTRVVTKLIFFFLTPNKDPSKAASVAAEAKEYLRYYEMYIAEWSAKENMQHIQQVSIYLLMRMVRYMFATEKATDEKVFVYGRYTIHEWVFGYIITKLSRRQLAAMDPLFVSTIGTLYGYLSLQDKSKQKTIVSLSPVDSEHSQFLIYVLYKTNFEPKSTLLNDRLGKANEKLGKEKDEGKKRILNGEIRVASQELKDTQTLYTTTLMHIMKSDINFTNTLIEYLKVKTGAKDIKESQVTVQVAVDYIASLPTNILKQLRFDMYLDQLAAISSFLVDNDLGSERFRHIKTNKYQNPVNVFFNFISIAYMAMKDYAGPSEGFFDYFWGFFNECMGKAATFTVSDKAISTADLARCPYSYRKYAELYYFIKFSIDKETPPEESQMNLLEFHPSSDVLVHHRIFFASYYEDDKTLKKVTRLCEKETTLDFCVTWNIIRATYQHCSGQSSDDLTPVQFYNLLAELIDFKTKRLDLSNQFNILSSLDALLYFFKDTMMGFDRFLAWFDPSFMESNYVEFAGLTKELKDAKPYDLPKTNSEKYTSVQAKSTLGLYLRLHYFKNKIDAIEGPISMAIAHAHEAKEMWSAVMVKDGTIQFYTTKIMLMFTRNSPDFEKLAELFMGNNYFLKIPKINVPQFDDLITTIITYVACAKFDSLKDKNGVIYGGKCLKADATTQSPAIYYQRLMDVMAMLYKKEIINLAADLEKRTQENALDKVQAKDDGFNTGNLAGPTAGLQLSVKETIDNGALAKSNEVSKNSKVSSNTAFNEETNIQKEITINTVTMIFPPGMDPTLINRWCEENKVIFVKQESSKTTVTEKNQKVVEQSSVNVSQKEILTEENKIPLANSLSTVGQELEGTIKKINSLNDDASKMASSMGKSQSLTNSKGGSQRLARRVLTRVSI